LTSKSSSALMSF